MIRPSPLFQPFQASQSSPREARRRVWRSVRQAAGAICLLVALALAGCGVSIDTGLGGGVSSATPGSGSAGSGANPGGSQSPPAKPKGGIVAPLNPCPGNSVVPTRAPTLVLTVKNGRQTAQAQTGDIIEVQLPATMNWSGRNDEAASVLTALQPQGGLDEQSHTCRWLYAVKAPGTTTLTFIGTLPCDPSVPCAAIAEDEEFTIQAS